MASPHRQKNSLSYSGLRPVISRAPSVNFALERTRSMSLLGIDLGTSNCKCVAFRENGDVIVQSSVSYTPYSKYPDWMEIDAEVFWDAFVKTVRTRIRLAVG